MQERQYANLWQLEQHSANMLPAEIREVFERTGPGCLAVESNIGIVHICHAADEDIVGFANKPVLYQWQLIQMPTAPLVRLELKILDDPVRPFMFESFLNVGEDDQLQVMAHLAGQSQLHLAFFGNDLTYRYTKMVAQDMHTWQMLDELMELALAYYQTIPPDQQDYEAAKAAFMRSYP